MKKFFYLILALLPVLARAQSYQLEYDPAIHSNKNTLVILGDSLTAGSHLNKSQTYPALMQNYFNEQGIGFTVVNGGINGDTTEGALKRVDVLLQSKVFLLIVEIGGNDGLRHYSLPNADKNIRNIIKKARKKGVAVILVDAKIPPSTKSYAVRFNSMCTNISRQMKVPLMPFILNNVYWNKKLMADSIHANEWGHWVIARDVLYYLNEKWTLPLPGKVESLISESE